MTLYVTIAYCGNFILVINTFLFFKSYRKNSVAFKIICFYLLSCVIIQSITEYLFSIRENNLYLSHFYFFGQFLFLSFFYRSILKSQIKKKVINVFLIIIPFLIVLLHAIHPEGFSKFNLIEVIITSLPIIFYAILYFSETLNSSKTFVYLNSGVFMYLISSTFLFSVGNFINSSPSEDHVKKYVWLLNVSLYLVYQLLIFLEWYNNFRKSTSSTTV